MRLIRTFSNSLGASKPACMNRPGRPESDAVWMVWSLTEAGSDFIFPLTGSGTVCGLQRTRKGADWLLQLVNMTDTEGQTSVERFPSPQTPHSGPPTDAGVESSFPSAPGSL